MLTFIFLDTWHDDCANLQHTIHRFTVERRTIHAKLSKNAEIILRKLCQHLSVTSHGI